MPRDTAHVAQYKNAIFAAGPARGVGRQAGSVVTQNVGRPDARAFFCRFSGQGPPFIAVLCFSGEHSPLDGPFTCGCFMRIRANLMAFQFVRMILRRCLVFYENKELQA